ncbi:MAG: CPBP family intramembrane glutamic endopeptidase [Daejeonella sp.]
MLKSGSTKRHPFTSLVLLLLLMLAGTVVFTVIAFIAGISIYGMKAMVNISEGEASSIEVLKLLQIFISTGMFVVPALFFARMESSNWMHYLKLKPFPVLFVLLTILIMLSSLPMLDLSSELNKSMKFPPFLKDIEEWMLLKEQQMAEMTKQLLQMNSVGVLLVNLFMLAVIPAIGEEFIFRGCLQKIFARWTGNKHAAIWITAIIFSAIHIQFYGFIPRMLLGALFGYLLVWSGSLWIPMLAHFMNNSIAVVTAYVYQQRGISLDRLDDPDPLPALVYVISLLACSGLLWVFYTTSLKYVVSKINRTDGSRLD